MFVFGGAGGYSSPDRIMILGAKFGSLTDDMGG
jgi:hypothetical protein